MSLIQYVEPDEVLLVLKSVIHLEEGAVTPPR